MTTEIEKDGWIVRGDSVDELMVGVAAVQSALSLGSDRPLAGQRERQSGRSPVRRRPRPRPRQRQPEGRTADQYQTARAFLQAIRDHGPSATMEPLITAVGVDSAKALGGTTAGINRVLKELGFEAEDVYSAEKIGKSRVWNTGEFFDEAMGKLEAKLSPEETAD